MYKVSSSLSFAKTHADRNPESSGETYWIPNTDVYVCDGGLVIKVELAGMKREDLELTIENNKVKISGYRPDGCRSANCKFLVMEINYGAFETVIELPKGYDLSRAKAAYQNGFLRIDVPPKTEKRPNRRSNVVNSKDA
ncbi:MAG: Hsp20/alpha crystallin family protein [Verrucomicrobia bacterium]|nr:Hsp20/alpha crystallin family protein [Verrucomicrobiota bacterium]